MTSTHNRRNLLENLRENLRENLLENLRENLRKFLARLSPVLGIQPIVKWNCSML